MATLLTPPISARPILVESSSDIPGSATLFSTAGASGVGEGRPYTVIYDGHCVLCGRLVRLLRAWDRTRQQLEIVPSQLPGVPARFPWIAPERYDASMQLVAHNGRIPSGQMPSGQMPSGRTWEGAAAVEQLLRVLPGGGALRWVFAVPGGRALADRLYRWVARNRRQLGCAIPPSS